MSIVGQAKTKREPSDLERALITRLKQEGLPPPQREWKFLPDRRFRFDLAYPEYRIGIEVEGAIWVQGRHTRGAGYESDCEKHTLAALNGWLLIRCTKSHIESGQAVRWISDALALREAA